MHKLVVSTFLLIFLFPASAIFEEYRFINRKILPIFKDEQSRKYAVIFDAGSTGSRVHVFGFDESLDLVPVGEDLELFVQTKPGLSAYETDPQAAADSLVPLLNDAEDVVPEELRSKTPVRLGATAGLRLLEGDAGENILEAVKDLLKNSSLKYEADGVSILKGFQEGSYMWIAINFLLQNLGKKYPGTVGVVDLGGGSVQMAYAISEADAANAPVVPDGEDPYVNKILVKETEYYLYSYSYLSYGLLAARAEILKVSKNSSANPCILAGYDGFYTYGGVGYKASGFPYGSSLAGCRRAVLKALNVSEPCPYKKCTFNGVWSGSVGYGQKNLYVASFFYDTASEVGFIDSNKTVAKVHPVAFKNAAKLACKTKFEDAKSTYPGVEEDDLPYICLDLVYQYTLLVDGFGLYPKQEITLVKEIQYSDYLVGAAWPLGSAIEAVSSVA